MKLLVLKKTIYCNQLITSHALDALLGTFALEAKSYILLPRSITLNVKKHIYRKQKLSCNAHYIFGMKKRFERECNDLLFVSQ